MLPPPIDRSQALRSLVADLWHFDRRSCSISLALATGSALTEGFGIVLLVPLLRRIETADGLRSSVESSGALYALLAAFVVVIGLRAVLVRTSTVFTDSLRLRWVDSLRLRSFRALTEAELSFVLRERPSDVINVLGPEIARLGLLTTALTTSVVRSLVVLGSVSAGLWIAPAPTAVALATGAMTGLIVWPMVARSRALGRQLTMRGREHLAVTTAFVDGVRQSKAHGAEAVQVAAYDDGAREVRETLLDHSRMQANLNASQQALAATALALIVGVSVVVFGLDSARLVPVLAVTGRVVGSVSPLSSAAQNIAHLLPAHIEVSSFLERATEAREAPAGGPPPPFADRLELRSVVVEYAGGPSIDIGTHQIARGSAVALVGPSGSGKSTTLDVIAGLIPPSSGTLAVDGVALGSDERRAWRQRIGYVAQAPLLSPGTVRENLQWGQSASDEELWEAAWAAHFDGVLRGLSDGLDTVLGRDSGLSGGERQRLNLARALVRRPSLLLLDEPTSALDPVSRDAIADTLRELAGAVTIVVATHQPDHLSVDLCIEIRPGRPSVEVAE